MEEKTRIVIKYVNNETQVFYSNYQISELKELFRDKINNDSKWIEVDTFFIQLDKVINLEISEF